MATSMTSDRTLSAAWRTTSCCASVQYGSRFSNWSARSWRCATSAAMANPRKVVACQQLRGLQRRTQPWQWNPNFKHRWLFYDAFFPRASERRVLLKVEVCYTSSHAHIFTSLHVHILTSSLLHHISSLSLSCPLSRSLSFFFFSLSMPQAVPTRRHDMASLSQETKFECQKLMVFAILHPPRQPFRTKKGSSVFFAILHPPRRPFRTKRGSSVKNSLMILLPPGLPSGSADQQTSGSADQRTNGSADQRISGSADQRISGSAD